MMSAVPFRYLQHLLVVPVLVGGIETRFIFDTGIGVNVISESLAAKVGCSPSGSTYTGRRMSGQEVTIPIGSVNSLVLGSHRSEDVPFGILNLAAAAGLGDIGGFISLTLFRFTPVTVDYPAGVIVLEDEQSLADRVDHGQPVSIHVDRHGEYSTDVHLALDLPSGRSITVEVDTGSDSLILDETLADSAGIDLDAASTRKVDGLDETGNAFVRYFATLTGEVRLTGAPSFRQATPEAMFQKIIHDGLIGDDFLRNFVTTYDLARSQMIFARPGGLGLAGDTAYPDEMEQARPDAGLQRTVLDLHRAGRGAQSSR
jgi:predicted aspartyl protease